MFRLVRANASVVWPVSVLLGSALLAACGGGDQQESPTITDDPNDPDPDPNATTPVGPSASPSDDPDDPINPEVPGEPGGPEPEDSPNTPEQPGPVSDDPSRITRVARLSHEQYRNTVADLFGIDDPPGGTFAPDSQNGFVFDSNVDYRVDGRLGPQYRGAAEELSERVLAEDAVFDFIVPCDAGSPSCSSEFIASFGLRAFRRPLTSDEQSRFATLFDRGAELVASGNDFRDGVALVVETMMQSPQFLYRVELSDTTDAQGRIVLDGFEVASRLSYFLWNTMPDDQLLALAEQGELETAEQIRTAAERLLADERAISQLITFHEQAWNFSKLSTIAPDSAIYPDAPDDLSNRAVEAGRLFIEDVVSNDGGFAELLTAPYGFADSAFASLYDADVQGGLTRVDFDANERKGFLMQVGFLASNAYAIKTDPIHRGLFIVRDLLCIDIPDPPPNASMEEPPETDTPPETTRDEVDLLTGQDGCATCHDIFNPAGFAFENFDAAGQLRTTDNGVQVNTSGSISLDGAVFEFDNAVQLVDALAESPMANECYASKLLSFAHGHSAIETDADLAEVLTATSSPSTRALAAAIAESPGFRQRVPNEVAP